MSVGSGSLHRNLDWLDRRSTSVGSGRFGPGRQRWQLCGLSRPSQPSRPSRPFLHDADPGSSLTLILRRWSERYDVDSGDAGSTRLFLIRKLLTVSHQPEIRWVCSLGWFPLQHIISSNWGRWFASSVAAKNLRSIGSSVPKRPRYVPRASAISTITRWCTNNARHHVLRFWWSYNDI